MRVFCPVHKKGFSAPRRNPIRCENRHHALGELDFEGRAREPVNIRWEYCCNCEHFWPSELADERCPVCDRQISARYLCDRCYTFSLESPTPVAVKNFTLGPEGAPQPSCPGCLQEAAGDAPPIQHKCDYLGVTYNTSFRSCPFCEELIGEAPSVPVPTDAHLNIMRAIKKVSLDYERDMFVETEDGELALIPDGNASNQPIVIPALTSFATKHDFYEHYQDLYHCESPSAGEVKIIEPAVVEKVEGGWRLSKAGRLEVHQAAQKTQHESYPQESPAVKSSPVRLEVRSAREKSSTLCVFCGATVELEKASAWHFCWRCGNSLDSKEASSRERLNASHLDPSRSEQTPTPRPSDSSFRLSILDPAVPNPDSPGGSGTTVKLIIAGLVGLAIIGTLIWLVLRSPPPALRLGILANDPGANRALQITYITPTLPFFGPEGSELQAVQARADTAMTSEQPQIIEALRAAEQKYPNDYRYPYERAKLSIVGVVAHDEAFAALLIAAERAMNTGRAREMLKELLSEKDTNFRKASRGHDEWKILVEALKNEDRTRLKDLAARLGKKGRN